MLENWAKTFPYLSLINVFTALLYQGYGSVIPDALGAESHPLTQSMAENVGKFVEQYVEAMEKVRNIIMYFGLVLVLVLCS